jgi:hypothetical protein
VRNTKVEGERRGKRKGMKRKKRKNGNFPKNKG